MNVYVVIVGETVHLAAFRTPDEANAARKELMRDFPGVAVRIAIAKLA